MINNPFNQLYPWQQKSWEDFLARRAQLPHALLMQSPIGVGEQVFAATLIASLFCQQPLSSGFACGHCPSCRLFLDGNHPDVFWLTPENRENALKQSLQTIEMTINLGEKPITEAKKSPSRDIKIEQIRDLIDFLSKSSHQGGKRIAVLWPAEQMNVAASNALLKILEEPGQGVLLILICYQPDILLPTVRSRCQSFMLTKPETVAAHEWLKQEQPELTSEQRSLLLNFANGAPLKAQQLAAKLISSSTEKKAKGSSNELDEQNDELPIGWGNILAKGSAVNIPEAIAYASAFGLNSNLQMIYRWIFDLMLGHHDLPPNFFSQHHQAISNLLANINIAKLIHLERKIFELLKVRDHPLSQTLQLEVLLLDYISAYTAR